MIVGHILVSCSKLGSIEKYQSSMGIEFSKDSMPSVHGGCIVVQEVDNWSINRR